MSREYYILQPDGTRSGPFAEEEVLDLLENDEIAPDEPCLDVESGRICPAGEMFHVIAPEPPPPPDPIPWQPAPFPVEKEKPSARPHARLLYRGAPSGLNYWRSAVLAGFIFSGGVLARHILPELLPLTQIAGSLILLAAALHLLRTQYYITTARVEVISGLLARSSRELRVADIRAINVERRGLIGLLGVGTITFSSSAGATDDVIFRNVWRPGVLKNLVRKLQDHTPLQEKSSTR